jgi:hypothetical protein
MSMTYHSQIGKCQARNIQITEICGLNRFRFQANWQLIDKSVEIQFRETRVQKFTPPMKPKNARRWFQTVFPTFSAGFFGPTLAIQYVLYYSRTASLERWLGCEKLASCGFVAVNNRLLS